jgi:xylose dehydrogenase (NAD/NADP)
MTMTDKLKWGVLSTAGINRAVIPPINEASRSELLAVASRDQAKAQAFASRWDIPRAYGSYEALLADPDVNAVYIPLPNTLHREWAIRAAQAGKHILCEKPLALSVADVDAMAQAAADHHVVLVEAFMYRMHPQMARLQKLIADGMIGAVKLIKAWFSFTLKDERNIRLIKEVGGGSLWDVGCYPVSFLQAVAGADPVEVMGWQRLDAKGLEIGYAGQLAFASGIVAQIECGFDLPSRRGAEVIGELGAAYLSNPWIPDSPGQESPSLRVVAGDAETTIHLKPVNPYLCEVQVMERAALDSAPVPYTLAHSRGNVATLVALYQSANERRPVRIVR